MKVSKQITRPYVVTTTFCDFCGNDVDDQKKMDAREYNTDEVEISHRRGWGYNSADYNIERIEIDCCGECFETKVLPALQAAGLKRGKTDDLAYEDVD